MAGTLTKQPKGKIALEVVRKYDAAADSKHRISLRQSKARYFHVTEVSNGSYLIEPRVLVAPEDVSPRTLKMLEKSMAALKKGKASLPIELASFLE